jgi:hypothetical protein
LTTSADRMFLTVVPPTFSKSLNNLNAAVEGSAQSNPTAYYINPYIVRYMRPEMGVGSEVLGDVYPSEAVEYVPTAEDLAATDWYEAKAPDYDRRYPRSSAMPIENLRHFS